MAETNAVPTLAEVKGVRVDIENYLATGLAVTTYAASALAQFKQDLEDKRGIKFGQVFDTTNDLYFADTDGATRNDDKCIRMLAYLTVALIFRDYAINTNESQWWELANEYEARYDDRLKITKLDIDTDEDGTIETDEERTSAQAFFIR